MKRVFKYTIKIKDEKLDGKIEITLADGKIAFQEVEFNFEDKNKLPPIEEMSVLEHGNRLVEEFIKVEVEEIT